MILPSLSVHPMHPQQLHNYLFPLHIFSQIYSMKFLVITLGCLLLIASTIDCKKVKNEKPTKGKEVRREKREAEVKKPKEIVKEIIVEKIVQSPRHEPHQHVQEEDNQQHYHPAPQHDEVFPLKKLLYGLFRESKSILLSTWSGRRSSNRRL